MAVRRTWTRTTETDEEWVALRAASKSRRLPDETDELWGRIVEARKIRNTEMGRAWRRNNPERARATDKAWRERRRAENPEEISAERHDDYARFGRDAHFRHRYGIGFAEVEAMYAAQNGRCHMCGKPGKIGQRGKTDLLCVDHDHITGRVRRLLCKRCNIWMGAVDDPEWLARAIEYRDSFRG